MIISIDTEMMNTMAGLAQEASEEQEASVVSLIPVTEHYDWNCKERDTINERIIAVKKGNQKLSQTLQDFAQAIKNVAKKFDEEELAIPSRYQYLDTLLGTCAGDTVGVVESTGGTVTKTIATEIATTEYVDTKLENYEMGNIIEPIKQFPMLGPGATPHSLIERIKEQGFIKMSDELLEELLKKSKGLE